KRPLNKRPDNAQRKNVWLIVVTAVLIIASVALFTPLDKKINQGLDIRGGLSVVLTAKSTGDSPISAEDMEKSRAIIETRVNALGASEAVVQLQGNNQILVQIPGLSDTETALATIGKTGKLVFARLDSFTDPEIREKIEHGEYIEYETVVDPATGITFIVSTKRLAVEEGTYESLITGSNIRRVSVGSASEASSYFAVNLELDQAGTSAFRKATEDLVSSHGQIVIILDGYVESAPAVQAAITDGHVSITGNYSLDEAKAFQTVLESGSLPVSFEYAQSQVVGPTLGQDALKSGVLVALLGLALVMLYLLFFYRGLGILTAAAMGVFAVLYLGILAFLSGLGLFSLSLAGVAGIVLTIGMAADSSILTMERFREEIRMGRSIKAASVSGVRHAIWTSIDADLVTLVSALSLFFLASASVKGFGLTLALGIFCDIAMMLLFKAPIIRLLAPRIMAKHPQFWDISDSLAVAQTNNAVSPDVAAAQNALLDDKEIEASDEPKKIRGRFIKKDINFMGYRRIFLTAACVVVIGSVAVVGIKGLDFGIEFVGGSSVTFHGTGEVSTEEVRQAFTEFGEPNAVIQTTEAEGEIGFLVRTTTTDVTSATSVANKVADKFGWTTDNFEVTTIGPDWGSSVISASLIAFLVSLVLIIIYIAIRFEYKMGVMAVVALLHDLVLVMGIYALVGREVNPNTIAALLTILGYSLYDTVVVFHRIADNMKQAQNPKFTFMSMANHSINQVFIRSINTTLTSLIPVLFMLLFGSATLQDFAFAMVIGLIAGTYSSIAIATPLFALWKGREEKYKKLTAKFGTKITRFNHNDEIIGQM
ncbi:MAG: protein translocase subunit SecD, partial [Eggerthellaceae bacterium]|nr:protein translocase subunit SecD [Eggerthellaceae bacterium]